MAFKMNGPTFFRSALKGNKTKLGHIGGHEAHHGEWKEVEDDKPEKPFDPPPTKHRISEKDFPKSNVDAHNSWHAEGKFKSETDHTPTEPTVDGTIKKKKTRTKG